MVTDCGSGCYSEHLIECSDTTRQGDKHIALQQQQVFAVRKVLAIDAYVHIVAYLSMFFNHFGNHPDGASASFVGRFCYAFHESHITASEHNGMTVACSPLSKFCC